MKVSNFTVTLKTGGGGNNGNRSGRPRPGAIKVAKVNNKVRDKNAAARETQTKVSDRRARGGAIGAVRRSLGLK